MWADCILIRYFLLLRLPPIAPNLVEFHLAVVPRGASNNDVVALLLIVSS